MRSRADQAANYRLLGARSRFLQPTSNILQETLTRAATGEQSRGSSPPPYVCFEVRGCNRARSDPASGLLLQSHYRLGPMPKRSGDVRKKMTVDTMRTPTRRRLY